MTEVKDKTFDNGLPMGMFVAGSFGYKTISDPRGGETRSGTLMDVEQDTDPTSFLIGRSAATMSLSRHFLSHYQDALRPSVEGVLEDGLAITRYMATPMRVAGSSNSNKSGLHFSSYKVDFEQYVHAKSEKGKCINLQEVMKTSQPNHFDSNRIQNLVSCALTCKLVGEILEDYSNLMLTYPERLHPEYRPPLKTRVFTSNIQGKRIPMSVSQMRHTSYFMWARCSNDRQFYSRLFKSQEDLLELATINILIDVLGEWAGVLRVNGYRARGTSYSTLPNPYSGCPADRVRTLEIPYSSGITWDMTLSIINSLLSGAGHKWVFKTDSTAPVILASNTLRRDFHKTHPQYASKGVGGISVTENFCLPQSVGGEAYGIDIISDVISKMKCTTSPDPARKLFKHARTEHRACGINRGVHIFINSLLKELAFSANLHTLFNDTSSSIPPDSIVEKLKEASLNNRNDEILGIATAFSAYAEACHPIVLLIDALLTRLYTKYGIINPYPFHTYYHNGIPRFANLQCSNEIDQVSPEKLMQERDDILYNLNLGRTRYGA